MTRAIITAGNLNTVLHKVLVVQPNELVKGLWFLAMTGEVKHTVTDLGNGFAELRTYRAPLPTAVSTVTYSYTVGGDDTVILGDVDRHDPDEGGE